MKKDQAFIAYFNGTTFSQDQSLPSMHTLRPVSGLCRLHI